MAIVNEKRRQHILAHKYRGRDDSLMYNYLISPLSEFLCKFVPSWIVPNVITMTGFFLCIMSHLIIVFYCQEDYKTPAPSWVYFFCAFSCTIYQIFDAMDGKHARKTNQSTPLGQLFDHGCDTVNVISNFFILFPTLQLGYSWEGVVAVITSSIAFFYAQWEEYHTGELVIHGKLNAPNEGMLLVIIILISAGLKGPSPLAQYPITKQLACHTLIAYLVFASFVLLLWENFNVVTAFKKSFMKKEKAEDSNVLAYLKSTYPVFYAGFLLLVWFFLCPGIYQRHTFKVIWVYGLVFSKMTTEVIIANICKEPLKLHADNFSLLAFWSVTIIANYLITYLNGPTSLIDGSIYFLLAYFLFKYFSLVISVISEFCQVLNTNCFFPSYKSK